MFSEGDPPGQIVPYTGGDKQKEQKQLVFYTCGDKQKERLPLCQASPSMAPTATPTTAWSEDAPDVLDVESEGRGSASLLLGQHDQPARHMGLFQVTCEVDRCGVSVMRQPSKSRDANK